MKNMLQNANMELGQYSCRSTEYYNLLGALSLSSPNWKIDAQSWKSFCEDTIDYYNQMVKICGSHRYLAVCICKFVNGIGQDFILDSISWISSILHQAKEQYDDNEISNAFIYEFERLIPRIEKRITSILSNQNTRLDLTTILDYLIIHNSLPAFKLRETIL